MQFSLNILRLVLETRGKVLEFDFDIKNHANYIVNV